MTDTSFDTPFVVSRYFSSGVNAMCQTRWPTSRYFIDLDAWRRRRPRRGWPGPSATKAVLPSLVMLMPTGWIASLRSPGISNVIFFDHHVLDGIDDADRSADLGGDPKLRAVLLELREARARIDEHVGDDPARVGVDEVRHVGGFGRVDQGLAVGADRHAFGLDPDLHVAEPRALVAYR